MELSVPASSANMLLETNMFTGGGLPDVSQTTPLPGGVGKISALAGITSGSDLAAAMKAAAGQHSNSFGEIKENLDAMPMTAPQRAAMKDEVERKNLSAKVRAAASVGGRVSTSTATPYAPPDIPQDVGEGGPDGSLFATGNGDISALTGGEGPMSNSLLPPPPPDLSQKPSSIFDLGAVFNNSWPLLQQ